MVRNSRSVIATRNGFEVRCFPVMLSLRLVLPMYKEILAIPTTSLMKNLGHLSTG